MAARRLPRTKTAKKRKKRVVAARLIDTRIRSGGSKKPSPATSGPRSGEKRGASPRLVAAKSKARIAKQGKSKKKTSTRTTIVRKRTQSRPKKVAAAKKAAAKKVVAKRSAKKKRVVRPATSGPRSGVKRGASLGKKKSKRVVRPTPNQQSAITRARRRLIEMGIPPKIDEPAARRAIYERRKQALINSLENAGYSGASIRARLGWITRYRETIRERVSMTRTAILGTLLDGRTREGWYVLRAMIEERDSRFRRFIAAAQREGMNYVAAVNEWFSPKML